MMRTFLLLLALTPLSYFAQSVYPDWSPAFLQNEVAEIRLTMHPDTVLVMLADNDPDNTHEYPAQFEYVSTVLQENVANIGVRLRGNTSLNAEKKSFKISFNSFVNQQWQGLEKMNLNANTNDPSLMRAKLVWDFMRFEGLPASRTSHVNVFINNVFKGVYLNVEHIDEEFADKYYDDGTGNLWKCLYPADLDYLGTNPDLYKIEQFGARTYDLHTNTFQDNYAQLAEFINVINNTNTANMPCELADIFNIENYIKYLAIDVLTGNWDGYAFNKNNFYLYHNEHTGLMEFLPYDLDNTLGIDWVGTDWGNRNIYSWKPSGQDRPLYSLVMNVPAYKAKFSYYIDLFISNYFNQGGIVAHAQEIQNLIATDIQADPFYPLDNGYTFDDFQQSIYQAWGAQVDYSINDFVQTRSASALNQLQNPAIEDAVVQLELKQYSDHSIRVEALVRSNQTNWIVVFKNSTNNSFISYDLNASSLEYALDEVLFTADITDITPGISYEVAVMKSSDFDSQNPSLPCVTRWLHTGTDSFGLVINELMPANSSTIVDQTGVAEDWIELYNAGAAPINLSNRFLTDDPDNWNKWPLPQMTLNAGDYFLIWADDDPSQGFNHAQFKLSANGETVVLWRQLNGAPLLIDSISFPALGNDLSFGRESDGNANWIVFNASTPDASNNAVSVIDEELSFNVFPNPAAVEVHFSRLCSGRLYDSNGKLALTWKNQSQLDVSSLASGTYYLSDGKSVRSLLVNR